MMPASVTLGQMLEQTEQTAARRLREAGRDTPFAQWLLEYGSRVGTALAVHGYFESTAPNPDRLLTRADREMFLMGVRMALSRCVEELPAERVDQEVIRVMRETCEEVEAALCPWPPRTTGTPAPQSTCPPPPGRAIPPRTDGAASPACPNALAADQ